MNFIDEAQIYVEAGNGGPGAKHFRREKFVPLGGPDGGNGGSGGSVILVADSNKNTLLDFRYRREWKAENGAPGGGSRKDGKSGEELRIPVPVGTEVYQWNPQREKPEELVCDLREKGQTFVVAKGGRGGKGNAFFKSATRQAPDFAQPGEEGDRSHLLLSLKLVADVGLIGLPNAGKSTLISTISAARPKIADYPFTTLEPNLGVVKYFSKTFVAADIPGLIPGASEGKGLGIQFLKHVERTKVLLHLIDISTYGEDPEGALGAYHDIRRELESFSSTLIERPEIIVLSKIDALPSPEILPIFLAAFSSLQKPVFAISSVGQSGLQELLGAVSKLLE